VLHPAHEREAVFNVLDNIYHERQIVDDWVGECVAENVLAPVVLKDFADDVRLRANLVAGEGRGFRQEALQFRQNSPGTAPDLTH
jgi:type IV secretory pathway TraG/TraD family ATPase VirD4